ncbi:MAG: SIS domain-containing protein [Clostridium sp.]|uniref:SIS domain-containing protein n=1 Tax=Clostridium sp. TaxID=1506 RepID=UPI0029117ECB|nr:SIS domain-containing protein [Clostridium sp.]MDU5111033.1 SIS domain-containing protein [Clostridium sp.]
MGVLTDRYFKAIDDLLEKLKIDQNENIMKAAEIIANSVMNGGIIQTFGSGHSYGTALEISGRTGGLIPTKLLREPSTGIYERIEGVGETFAKECDFRQEDCIVIISNSGRNPISIEIAKVAKENGLKIIVLTSYEVSKNIESRHSSGKKLFDYADVILDNMGVYGDSALEVEGIPVKVGATSSIAGAMLLNSAVLESMDIMLKQGFTPPIFMSANIDGGLEYNDKLLCKYKDRLNRL